MESANGLRMQIESTMTTEGAASEVQSQVLTQERRLDLHLHSCVTEDASGPFPLIYKHGVFLPSLKSSDSFFILFCGFRD
jgi:hypothetical protein